MNNAYLIDTHVLLWFLAGDKSISKTAKSIPLNTDNRCFVSIASLWEIAIKINLGKLTIESDFSELANLLFQMILRSCR